MTLKSPHLLDIYRSSAIYLCVNTVTHSILAGQPHHQCGNSHDRVNSESNVLFICQIKNIPAKNKVYLRSYLGKEVTLQMWFQPWSRRLSHERRVSWSSGWWEWRVGFCLLGDVPITHEDTGQVFQTGLSARCLYHGEERISKKNEKRSQNDKTGHEMEKHGKDNVKSKPKSTKSQRNGQIAKSQQSKSKPTMKNT
ncbi:hypothetical protein Tco_1141656 [Tanacetum coccineum]